MSSIKYVITILLMILVSSSILSAELVVVVHKDNPVSELSRKQVLDIYMGRKKTFPSGLTAKPVDLPDDAHETKAFYGGVVKKSVPEIKAYWARLLFTGRATPPVPLASQIDVLNYFSDHKNAIAYISPDRVSDKVKVVYRVKDEL